VGLAIVVAFMTWRNPRDRSLDIMVITSKSRHTRHVGRTLGSGVVVLSLVGVLGVSVATARAPATVPRNVSTALATTSRETRPHLSSICRRVSAASVAAIVGHSVPAPTAGVFPQSPTKKNLGISGVLTICTYGTETSATAISQTVALELDVTSKPITLSEVERKLAQTSTASSKITMTPYSGLGAPAFYFTDIASSLTAQGMEVVDGTRSIAATVFTTRLSKTKFAALTKLAEKL
jgi:hypothetical protein